MVTKLRLFAALGALVTAVVVVSQSAAPAIVGTPNVQLRSTAAPMDPPTTMKSPIVATTDPSPFNPCQDIPFDVVQRLGLAFTPPEPEEGLRCHYDAGNYQLAVQPIVWRNYDQSLPADAVETTINGHRRPVVESQAPLPQQLLVLLLHGGLQDQLRVIQQSLYYSTVYSSPEVDVRPPTCSGPTTFRLTTSSEPTSARAAIT